MKYLIFILLLLSSFWKVPTQNGWAFRQILGLGILSLIISWLLSKKYHFFVGLCFFVTMIFGLIQQGVPQFGTEVTTSLIALLFYACIGLSLPEDIFDKIFPVLSLIVLGDAIMVLICGIPHFGEAWGHMNACWVMTNGTLDACFMALMSPIILSSFGWFPCIFLLAAIVLTKSNTAIFLIPFMSCIYLLLTKSWKKLGDVILISFILLAIIYLVFPEKFMSDSGRFNNWELMMNWWNQKVKNHWIGTGPGTYWVYSQWLQGHKSGDPVWSWMHNDWLQILFEQGILGLISVLFLYGAMLHKSFDRPVLFSMIVGYGFIGLTLYPLHLFIFQLIGVTLIHKTFIDEPIEMAA